jgi:hypothetical protein
MTEQQQTEEPTYRRKFEDGAARVIVTGQAHNRKARMAHAARERSKTALQDDRRELRAKIRDQAKEIKELRRRVVELGGEAK